MTTYALGHDDDEMRRLELQSDLLAAGTERMLRAAGLAPGHSILDIGTGAGDVAMIAGAIVGISGSVLGIDREARALDRARARSDAADLHGVQFEAAALETLPAGQTFDFVVGRWVLCWQDDQVDFLRRAARMVRPGGRLMLIEPGCHELASVDEQYPPHSHPPVPSFEKLVRLSTVAAILAGVHCHTGFGLVELFRMAGLPEPALDVMTPVGGPNSPIVEWHCRTVKSLLPVLEKHGIVTANDFDFAELPDRLKAEAASSNSQFWFVNTFGAWATLG